MEVVRMFLILVHLIGLIMATTSIAFGDYALMSRRRIDTGLLDKASLGVAIGLLVLWVSGLAVIWVDTQFDLALILSKPKLVSKLIVVSLLTLNGVYLHHTVLPALKRSYASRSVARRVAKVAAVAGAISSACWVFGLFLGIAKPLAAILGFSGFMALFALTVAGALTAAQWAIRPKLAQKLHGQSASRERASQASPARQAPGFASDDMQQAA